MIVLGAKNSLRRNLVALLVAGPWLFVAFVRILSLDAFWPLTSLVAFAPQTVVTLLVPLGVALLLRARWSALGLVVVMVWLSVLIAPRTIADDRPAARGETIHLYSANLKKGAAKTSALMRQIRASRADLITLQEAGVFNVSELRAAGLMKTHPYVDTYASDGLYANVTISRWPLRSTGDDYVKTGIWPGLRVARTPITLYNFHSFSPTTPARESAWAAGIGALPAAGDQVTLIAGDFNATLDHRIFRALLARGYVDAADQTGNGLAWTWVIGRLTRLVIDHILVPPSVAVADYEVHDLPGSDHNAVSATLRLPG